MATEWYWLRQDREQGPISFRDLAMLVQLRVVNEIDLVRTGGLSQKWEKAYRVPGLFYMAQRVAELPPDEVRPNPDPPEFAEVALDSIPWEECESVHGSGVDLYSGADDGEATNSVGIVDELAASRGLRTDSGEFESPEGHTEIATAIKDATEDWDRRHAAPLVTEGESYLVGPRYAVLMAPFVWCGSAFVSMVGGIVERFFCVGKLLRIGPLCWTLERLASRQVIAWWFRGGCAVVTATIGGWCIHSWSRYETLRYPDRDWLAAGKAVFPMFGVCSPAQFAFIFVDALIVCAIAGYFGAKLLERFAED